MWEEVSVREVYFVFHFFKKESSWKLQDLFPFIFIFFFFNLSLPLTLKDTTFSLYCFSCSRAEKRSSCTNTPIAHGKLCYTKTDPRTKSDLGAQHSKSRISAFAVFHPFGKEIYRKFCQSSMESCQLTRTAASSLTTVWFHYVSPLLQKTKHLL